jgi:hypothetical protein
MQAKTRKFDLLAFLLSCIEQARKPRKRHTGGASVGQVDPHGMFVKANGRWRNGHAMLVRWCLEVRGSKLKRDQVATNR